MVEGYPQANTGHDRFLGIVLLSEETGVAEYGLDWRDDLMAQQFSQVPASAPILSLMEGACSRAVSSALSDSEPSVILSLRVDHLRPARPGRRLVGRAECVRITSRIAFARGIAHDGDENDPVANINASFFRVVEA